VITAVLVGTNVRNSSNVHLYTLALLQASDDLQLRRHARMWCGSFVTASRNAIRYTSGCWADDAEGVNADLITIPVERQDERQLGLFPALNCGLSIVHPMTASAGPVSLNTLLHRLVVEQPQAKLCCFTIPPSHWFETAETSLLLVAGYLGTKPALTRVNHSKLHIDLGE
jgi:hypothetical protein